jgi:hypothetical protein
MGISGFGVRVPGGAQVAGVAAEGLLAVKRLLDISTSQPEAFVSYNDAPCHAPSPRPT